MSHSDEKEIGTPPPEGDSQHATGGKAAPTSKDFSDKARQGKLRVALSNLKSGKIHTAADMLLDLYHGHPQTPEGHQAGVELGRLAESYEATGRHRMAADLYKKLSGD